MLRYALPDNDDEAERREESGVGSGEWRVERGAADTKGMSKVKKKSEKTMQAKQTKTTEMESGGRVDRTGEYASYSTGIYNI